MNNEKYRDVVFELELVVNAYEGGVVADPPYDYINNDYGDLHSQVPWQKAC